MRKYLQWPEPKNNKKWQATHIAPLQPPILAAFLPWGGSAGAGRVRPATVKVMNYSKLVVAFLKPFTIIE